MKQYRGRRWTEHRSKRWENDFSFAATATESEWQNGNWCGEIYKTKQQQQQQWSRKKMSLNYAKKNEKKKKTNKKIKNNTSDILFVIIIIYFSYSLLKLLFTSIYFLIFSCFMTALWAFVPWSGGRLGFEGCETDTNKRFLLSRRCGGEGDVVECSRGGRKASKTNGRVERKSLQFKAQTFLYFPFSICTPFPLFPIFPCLSRSPIPPR